MEAVVLAQVSFVHPALAAAALATGLIPILVHFLNRRRYRRVPWAAMIFLLAAAQRSAKRLWLEQWLLMMLRIAVIVLLGLAIARPFLSTSSAFAIASSRAHRILIVDNSLSMSARDADGGTRFEHSRAYADRLLATFPVSDEVSIITAAAPARTVVGDASADRRFVREQLDAVAATQRHSDMVGAIEQAVELVRSSDVAVGNVSVYLFSDMLKSEWLDRGDGKTESSQTTAVATAARRLRAALVRPDVNLTIVRASGGDMENVAITELTPETPLTATHWPVRINAEVSNLGNTTIRNLSIQARRDGEIIRREPLPMIEPYSIASTTLALEFSSPGSHVLEVRVVGSTPDSLPIDDVRYLSLEVRDSAPVLIVDGRPGSSPLTGQAGYVATALSPKLATGEASFISTSIIAESELASEVLSNYDVIVLCNVERLSPEQWKHLERTVADGIGLLIFGGDQVNVDNYNRFGYAEGKGIIPGRFGRPAAISADNSASGRFNAHDATHTLVTELASDPGGGLFLARVDRYLPFETDPQRAEIALRYTNGDAALVISTFGAGRLAVFTTSADMEWTNFPAKGDFVSLMFHTMAYLAQRHGEHRNVVVGEFLIEPLNAAQSSMPIHVTAGEGTTLGSSLTALGNGLAARWGPMEKSGVFQANIGMESRGYAVNTDPTESELASLSQEEFFSALGGSAIFVPEAADAVPVPTETQSTELALPAFCLLSILLMGEIWLAMRLGLNAAGGG